MSANEELHAGYLRIVAVRKDILDLSDFTVNDCFSLDPCDTDSISEKEFDKSGQNTFTMGYLTGLAEAFIKVHPFVNNTFKSEEFLVVLVERNENGNLRTKHVYSSGHGLFLKYTKCSYTVEFELIDTYLNNKISRMSIVIDDAKDGIRVNGPLERVCAASVHAYLENMFCSLQAPPRFNINVLKYTRTFIR